MTRAVTIRRTTLGLLAAGATCAMLGLPSAGADPADPVEPTPATAPADATPAATPAAIPQRTTATLPVWRRPSALSPPS